MGRSYFLFQRLPLETPFLSSFSLRWSLRRNFSFPPPTLPYRLPQQSRLTSKLIYFPSLRKKCLGTYLTFFLPALAKPNLSGDLAASNGPESGGRTERHKGKGLTSFATVCVGDIALWRRGICMLDFSRNTRVWHESRHITEL